MKNIQEKKQKDCRLSKSNKKKKWSAKSLPPIPDKRYFTISEVSHLCGVKAYVLRYWEQEFPQLKPLKRQGNRRYYQHPDILLVREIKKLLYQDGFTIEGARSKLSNTSETISQSVTTNAMVKKVIAELETVLQNLQSEIAISR